MIFFQFTALIPNSAEAVSCAAWLNDYFMFHGDVVPNSEDAIHLEPVDKCSIYAEYFSEISGGLLKVLQQ